MTLVVLLRTFVPVAAAQSSKTSAVPAAKDQCSITGTVVEFGRSEPLKNAVLQLSSAEDSGRDAVAVKTDAGGRFEFTGLDAGRYRLRAMRHGFVSQEYGQRKLTDPGAVLTLRPGQDMKDLLFRMIPSAVISGRIENEDGDSLPWVSVGALRESYREGNRTLSIEQTVLTNDHGEYRIFGLRPGRYIVAASYRGAGSQMRGDEDWSAYPLSTGGVDYVRTYYPGTLDPAKAQAITLKAGEEISSTDLRLQPIAVHSIRGRVYNLFPTIDNQRHNTAFVQLRSRGTGLYSRDMFARGNSVKADGTFELPSVAAGSYILTAEFFEEGKVHQAITHVEVGNADVEGVQLTIKPGVAVSGHLYWEGKPSISVERLTVMVHGGDEYFGLGSWSRVATDGTFTFKEVADGQRRVVVGGMGDDCYLKAVTYGGVDALEDGFVPRAGSDASLDVMLSSRAARVQGAVADPDGLPSVGVWVVLVPDAKPSTRQSSYKSTQTDQHGQFILRGIAPGDYSLFSWDEVEIGAWENPDFLRPFQDKGVKVSVREDDIKSADLVIITNASEDH
jgi:hypothetical protein